MRQCRLIWVAGKKPCVVLPDMTIVPLLVWGDIPYMDLAHEHEMSLLDGKQKMKFTSLRAGPGAIRLSITKSSFQGHTEAAPVVDVGVNTVTVASSTSRCVGAPAVATPGSSSSSVARPEVEMPLADEKLFEEFEEAVKDIKSQHCVLHDHADDHPDCEACMRGKSNRWLHFRGS